MDTLVRRQRDIRKKAGERGPHGLTSSRMFWGSMEASRLAQGPAPPLHPGPHPSLHPAPIQGIYGKPRTQLPGVERGSSVPTYSLIILS